MYSAAPNVNPRTSMPGGVFPGSGFGFGMPSVPGMDFGMASMQSLFTQSMTMMTVAMMGLMTQIMSQQISMLGGGTVFGANGGKQGASPLNAFLGGGAPAAGGKPGTGKFGAAKAGGQPKGGRIPGGRSLYNKGRGMFHKGAPGAPNTYAFENSPAGIAFAAKHGYASIDLDMQLTKDGVPVNTHWSRPLKKDGFYDPLHKIPKNRKVSDMTLAEVMRLRNKDGRSRIFPISTMVNLLKKHGIAGDFEVKDARLGSDKMMGYLANLVRNAGIKANVKTIDRNPSVTERILHNAQEAGFWTRIALSPKAGHKKYWGYGG